MDLSDPFRKRTTLIIIGLLAVGIFLLLIGIFRSRQTVLQLPELIQAAESNTMTDEQLSALLPDYPIPVSAQEVVPLYVKKGEGVAYAEWTIQPATDISDLAHWFEAELVRDGWVLVRPFSTEDQATPYIEAERDGITMKLDMWTSGEGYNDVYVFFTLSELIARLASN